jgi:uroporphyrinogen decarboxylase
MVSGGKKLVEETKKLRDQMSEGPYIFNLGHGITPDADPKNVEIMLNTLRS